MGSSLVTTTPPTPSKELVNMTSKDLADWKKAENEYIELVKKSMAPELLEVTGQVAETLDKWMESGFRKTWNLGKLLSKVGANEDKYGKSPLNKMAVVLKRSSSLMYKAKRFYEAYDDKAVDKLLSLKMKTSGEILTFGHLEISLKVKDPDERLKLLETAAANDWTAEEMDHGFRLLSNASSAKQAGGRPIKIPQTITAKIESLENVGSIFLKKNDEIWSHKSNGFVASVEEMPADKITDDFVASLDDSAALVDDVIKKATDLKEDLAEAIKLAQTRAAAQDSEEDDKSEKKGSTKPKKLTLAK